jgi:hypothetical protein
MEIEMSVLSFSSFPDKFWAKVVNALKIEHFIDQKSKQPT